MSHQEVKRTVSSRDTFLDIHNVGGRYIGAMNGARGSSGLRQRAFEDQAGIFYGRLVDIVASGSLDHPEDIDSNFGNGVRVFKMAHQIPLEDGATRTVDAVGKVLSFYQDAVARMTTIAQQRQVDFSQPLTSIQP